MCFSLRELKLGCNLLIKVGISLRCLRVLDPHSQLIWSWILCRRRKVQFWSCSNKATGGFLPSQVCSASEELQGRLCGCRRLFLNVTHLNEAENREFQECGQMYLNVNPCSLGYPGFVGRCGGNPRAMGWGGQELLKPTRLYFALFLLYFKPVLNGRPGVEYPWLVPVGSQLGAGDLSAVYGPCRYLADCRGWKCAPPGWSVPGPCPRDLQPLTPCSEGSPKNRAPLFPSKWNCSPHPAHHSPKPPPAAVYQESPQLGSSLF